MGADIGGAGVPIHKLITNKARRKKLTAYLKKLDLDMQDAYEAQNDGREPPRPRCTKPFVILPEHCAGWAHGHYFDTSDPQRLRPTIRTGRLGYTREHCASSEWGKAIGDRDSYVEKSGTTWGHHRKKGGFVTQTVCDTHS